MIVSNPKGLFFDLCKRINRRRLRRNFGALRAGGWHYLLDLPHGTSLLVLANHHTWWDERLLLEIFGQTLDYDSYWMTEISRLKKRLGLARIGAFSIQPDHPEECRRSVQHIADLLERPQRVVGLFPQMRPAYGDIPLVFQNQVCELLFQHQFGPHVQVLNVVTDCRFRSGSKPEWFVQIGRPTAVSDLLREGKTAAAILQSSLAELQDEFRIAVGQGNHDGFTLLWTGLNF